jgi:hypothetical protein
MRLLAWFASIYVSLFATDWLVYGDPLAAYPPPTDATVISLLSAIVPEPTVGLIPAMICSAVFFLQLQAVGPVR